MGDDASTILLLDTDYKKIDLIRLFNYPEKRIPKSKKYDLEASALIKVNGRLHFLLLGSASGEQRKKVILIPLESLNSLTPYLREYDDDEFIERIVRNGIDEVNIEGVTAIGGDLVLANRGNDSNQINHLIITGNYFWERQKDVPVHVTELLLPAGTNGFIGISELCYLRSKNILLLTLCKEATSNSYDDGTIGDSYIGWISNITNKIRHRALMLDGIINLSDVNAEFKNQKIEGICKESVRRKDEFIFHLVSDNDAGESKLFKVKLF